MARPFGRPRGTNPRYQELEAALRDAGADNLGLTIAAIVAELYPVPIPYSRVSAALEAVTGVRVGRRIVHQWLTEARKRLHEANNTKEVTQ